MTQVQTDMSSDDSVAPELEVKEYTYDDWMASVGVPIHRGYFIEDLRTVELGWWEERGCESAFIQLVGQEGVTSAMVQEIPPGETLPPLKFALDELVYVLQGQGVTTVWPGGNGRKNSFEWQPRSLFQIPHNYHHTMSNMRGDQPVRLLRYSYLPLAMSLNTDPSFFFNNHHEGEDFLSNGGQLYSEAKLVRDGDPARTWGGRSGIFWYGNFFPDMGSWNKLNRSSRRGAGGHSVLMTFPHSEMSCHMSVFPSRTYKKAHRHGPGRVIVIPAGEGYSILWEEGKEKVVAPWHEASMFVPPGKWFHQHFNAGGTPARYLALHPPRQFRGHAEKIEDRARDQIEYADEDPWIRERFEAELDKRALTTLMPDEVYRDRDFQWTYRDAEPQAAR